MKTERSTRVQWHNWTFGAWYAPRRWRQRHRSKLIAGVDIGPFQVLWTEPLQLKQLHPRVQAERTLQRHSERGDPPSPAS